MSEGKRPLAADYWKAVAKCEELIRLFGGDTDSQAAVLAHRKAPSKSTQSVGGGGVKSAAVRGIGGHSLVTIKGVSVGAVRRTAQSVITARAPPRAIELKSAAVVPASKSSVAAAGGSKSAAAAESPAASSALVKSAEVEGAPTLRQLLLAKTMELRCLLERIEGRREERMRFLLQFLSAFHWEGCSTHTLSGERTMWTAVQIQFTADSVTSAEIKGALAGSGSSDYFKHIIPFSLVGTFHLRWSPPSIAMQIAKQHTDAKFANKIWYEMALTPGNAAVSPGNDWSGVDGELVDLARATISSTDPFLMLRRVHDISRSSAQKK
jgi:hypothetical protein